MSESVLMVIPPAESSAGIWKFEIITPGKLLNALREMVFFNEMLSKIVPNAVTLNLEVEIAHSKLELCSK